MRIVYVGGLVPYVSKLLGQRTSSSASKTQLCSCIRLQWLSAFWDNGTVPGAISVAFSKMRVHIFLSSYRWVKKVTRMHTARKLFTDLNFSFDIRRIFFLLLTHVCQNLTTLHNCIIFKVNCKNRHQLKPFRSFQSFLRQVSLELER